MRDKDSEARSRTEGSLPAAPSPFAASQMAGPGGRQEFIQRKGQRGEKLQQTRPSGGAGGDSVPGRVASVTEGDRG